MSKFRRFQRVEKHHERNGQRLRSGFEAKVYDQLTINKITFEYEPCNRKIEYIVPSRKAHYLPDFFIEASDIYIEVKGLLDTDDRKKHLLIKEQYGDRFDIRFVFWSSKTPIYPGSKTTCGQWATEHGFKYADRIVPTAWFKERKKQTQLTAEQEFQLMRKNMTQEEFVKAYLESGRAISPAKAAAEFNITRLAAVVHKLKTKHDMNIVKNIKQTFTNRNYAEYFLAN